MNLGVVGEIAKSIFLIFVGVFITRLFEKRPKLISYFGDVSSFLFTPPNGNQITVYAHSVILRNSGRANSTNVRIHHSVLPDFSIWPSTVHHVQTLPDGGKDIVIPTMIPGEQITISYLYFPPTTYRETNAGIKSDQGFARPITMLAQPKIPRWQIITVWVLMLFGVGAISYLVYLLYNHFQPAH
jgi:hypothetical protein